MSDLDDIFIKEMMKMKETVCDTNADVKCIKKEMDKTGKILTDHNVRLYKAELNIALIKDRRNFVKKCWNAILTLFWKVP